MAFFVKKQSFLPEITIGRLLRFAKVDNSVFFFFQTAFSLSRIVIQSKVDLASDLVSNGYVNSHIASRLTHFKKIALSTIFY